MPGQVRGGGGGRHRGQKEGEPGHPQPDGRAGAPDQGGGVHIQAADQQTAGHPAQRAHDADGAKFPPGVRQPGKDDGRGNAPDGGHAEGLQLDDRQNQPRVPVLLDGVPARAMAAAVARASPRRTFTGEAWRSAMAPNISGEMKAATAEEAKA